MGNGFLMGKPKGERVHLEDPGVDEKIILKVALEEGG